MYSYMTLLCILIVGSTFIERGTSESSSRTVTTTTCSPTLLEGQTEIPNLSKVYERVLSIYEETLMVSQVYLDSAGDIKAGMLKEIANMRNMFAMNDGELSAEDQEVVKRFRELESLSDDYLRRTMTSLFSGPLHVDTDEEEKI